MAYAPNDRCQACHQPVDVVFVPDLGKVRSFDPTHIDRSGDPLARWAEYPDPRTGASVARRLATGEQPAPDERLLRLHRAACPAAPHTRTDS